VANTALLNNIDHADLTVAPGYSAAFGDVVNQTVVFPTEYTSVQREYVILIQKMENGTFQSVALLGLDRDENLFLEGNVWNARYVPAMHRRGPFMIGFQDVRVDGQAQREPMIHVDLDHPRVGKQGQPAFLPQGGNSPYLTHVMSALQIIHEGAAMMQRMFAAFDAHGLLENTVIEIGLSETEQYRLEDYYVINPARLAALDGEALYMLHQQRYLAAAFSIVASIDNAQHLITLKNRKLAG
jgi:SapC